MKGNKPIILFCFTLFFIAGAIYKNLNKNYKSSISSNPKDLIVGTWQGIKPEGIIWKFNADGTMKEDGDTGHYKLVKGATHEECKGSGYEAVYNPDQLVLIQTIYSQKECYMVDYLGYHKETGKTRMTLFSESSGQYLSFVKQ